MKKIKKLFIVLTLILTSFIFISCNQQQPTTPPINTPPVVETPPVEEQTPEEVFEDYGFPIIEIDLSEVTIIETGYYTSLEEVGAYIYTYEKLPSNYKVKGVFNKNNYSSSTLESCGGDRFYNREGLLPTGPTRTYTECDIDYQGGGRNAKRIVYSSDMLIFYTSDHYASFSILKFVE